MKKKVNTKSILAKAKLKSYRSKVSFTFDLETYRRFQAACAAENVHASRVIEEFMLQFIEDH